MGGMASLCCVLVILQFVSFASQDDQASMDFVTSAANVRAHIFSIPLKSRFDVKGLRRNVTLIMSSFFTAVWTRFKDIQLSFSCIISLT